ncbi:MAG TPA: acyl-CoA dehydrogenase family protein [Acetobacteraceae bacterium]
MMDGLILRAPTADAIPLELAEHAAEVDRTGAFPWDGLEALHADGLLALTARGVDGGQEAGLARVADLVRRAGQGCASTALILAMQLTHLRTAARSDWPEHLRALVGRGAGRSGALINALRVEPALGTPARGGLPATTARRTADGWSISGRKIYSTGAPGLTWMLVFARVEPGGSPDIEPGGSPGTDEDTPRMGLFLVPAHAPGVRIEDTWDQLGLRGSGSHDVVFEGVTVPADHAVDLRAPADWARPDPEATAWNALLIAAIYTGVAEAARDWTVGFLRDRVPANLGASLATLPRMQEAVGRIEALLLTNRRLVACAAADTDAGRPPAPSESGLIKTVAAENAIKAVQHAMQLAGNHGLSRANPLERHLRDVLCARVHTPQLDAAFTAAGRAALGQ